MKREHGNFDGKSNKERQENPELVFPRKIQLLYIRDTEGINSSDLIVVEIKRQDSQQHQQGPKQGVQEKLNCRIELSRPAPDANKEIHGNQHDFPEKIKEEE